MISECEIEIPETQQLITNNPNIHHLNGPADVNKEDEESSDDFERDIDAEDIGDESFTGNPPKIDVEGMVTEEDQSRVLNMPLGKGANQNLVLATLVNTPTQDEYGNFTKNSGRVSQTSSTEHIRE